MVKINAVISADTTTRKMKSASTLFADVEALAGQNGMFCSIATLFAPFAKPSRALRWKAFHRRGRREGPQRSRSQPVKWLSLKSSGPLMAVHRAPTHHQKNERPEKQHGCDARQPQQSQNDRAVFSLCRVVVIAVEEHLIDKVADLSLPRLYQSQAKILRRILHTVVVLRNLALGRQDHDRGGVRALLRLLVVLVLKAGSVRERIDRGLVADQKMPSLFGPCAFVSLEQFGFLRGSHLGSFVRIKTDRNHVKF